MFLLLKLRCRRESLLQYFRECIILMTALSAHEILRCRVAMAHFVHGCAVVVAFRRGGEFGRGHADDLTSGLVGRAGVVEGGGLGG